MRVAAVKFASLASSSIRRTGFSARSHGGLKPFGTYHAPVRRLKFSHSRSMTTCFPVFAGSSSSDSFARQLKVAHILLPSDQEDTIVDLRKRIEAGESFQDLAKEHSLCPSKRQGGDLGWISKGRTVAEFEEAAFKASPGAVVQVKTQFGWHLLTVLSSREVAEVKPLSAQDLAEKLTAATVAGDSDTQFIDVREEGELQLSSLPHFKLYPLSRFEEWSPVIKRQLDPEKETVVLCHHGIRSMQMAQFLIGQGFTDVKNVTGGIDAYSRGVDSSVPLY